jgi:hypothetical protein
VVEVLITIEKVLLEVMDQKISEALFLVPDNYGETRLLNLEVFCHTVVTNIVFFLLLIGKFVISIDDMMPQVCNFAVYNNH